MMQKDGGGYLAVGEGCSHAAGAADFSNYPLPQRVESSMLRLFNSPHLNVSTLQVPFSNSSFNYYRATAVSTDNVKCSTMVLNRSSLEKQKRITEVLK